MDNTNTQATKNASAGNIINVTINDRNIPVKKLGLIKYTVMMGSIKELLASIVEVIRVTSVHVEDDGDEIPVAERGKLFAEALTSLLSENLIQVIKLLDLCVPDLGYEYICDEVGLEDVMKLLEAIVEVNKFEKVIHDVKNLMRGLQL